MERAISPRSIAMRRLLEYLPGRDLPVAYEPDARVRYWREFCSAGGLRLDAKFWNVEGGAVAAVSAAIEAALTDGWSVDKAVATFVFSGAADEFVRDRRGTGLAAASPAHDRVIKLFLRETLRAYKAVAAAQAAFVKRSRPR